MNPYFIIKNIFPGHYLFLRICCVFCAGSVCINLCGQSVPAGTTGAHSHNDYEQKFPFRSAYDAGFGSVEADIFLINREFIVAHDKSEIKAHRTLVILYLDPMAACLKANNGHIYKERSKSLQLLIDIKDDSVTTLQQLVLMLSQKYSGLTVNPSVRFVITGNRPASSQFTAYPGFISFDGVLSKHYSDSALSRIPMLSDNFKNYSAWDGQGEMTIKDSSEIVLQINYAHALGKKIRFWNAPDDIHSWKLFRKLGVDYINTDHIAELEEFLQNKSSKQILDRSNIESR